MGLLGVPVRTASKLKEELLGCGEEEEDDPEGFLAWFGSSLREFEPGVGIHADVESVGRILE